MSSDSSDFDSFLESFGPAEPSENVFLIIFPLFFFVFFPTLTYISSFFTFLYLQATTATTDIQHNSSPQSDHVISDDIQVKGINSIFVQENNTTHSIHSFYVDSQPGQNVLEQKEVKFSKRTHDAIRFGYFLRFKPILHYSIHIFFSFQFFGKSNT